MCGPQENCLNPEVVEQICRRNPILRYSHHPLHSPLLPLPYGDAHFSRESETSRTAAAEAAAGFQPKPPETTFDLKLEHIHVKKRVTVERVPKRHC